MSSSFDIKKLAIPSVTALIAFLAYSSQILFIFIEPGPLRKNEHLRFNILVVCIWICYFRACFTDPGRVPSGWKPPNFKDLPDSGSFENDELFDNIAFQQRWCRRCEAFKPPRAHHCKACGRCIPKMDHHCPWTRNCVSHFTFPHFMRFLFYAIVSMGYLERFLYTRGAIVWENRRMPSYHGPSVFQLCHLFMLFFTNTMVLFLLTILLLRTVWMLALNQTTIEGWEIERHQTLVRRAKGFGGFLEGPGGVRIRIRKQEFPYDIGIWRNITDGMGGSNNILAWLFPFSPTPPIASGLEFGVNGFEDSSLPWPPPDPDRLPRRPQQSLPLPENSVLFTSSYSAAQPGLTADAVTAFRQRQDLDLLRYRQSGTSQSFREPRHNLRHSQNEKYHADDYLASEEGFISSNSEATDSASGEEGWRTAEGDRLRDFGVDEDAEFYEYEYYGQNQMDHKVVEEDDNEDDIPLAKLLEKRKEQAQVNRRL